MVSSLDDGMNLVAKEFVSATKPEKGVLLLSKYAGASQELDKAALINPFNVQDSVEKLHQALIMSASHKKQINTALKMKLQSNSIANWAHSFITKTLQAS